MASRVETVASVDENSGTEITDTSLYWPRNRLSASDTNAAESNSLFPFEKQHR